MDQVLVFLGLTALVGVLTWWRCRKNPPTKGAATDFFLAGGTLTWPFVAGSLTLTNINTDTLVGWNGNQMLMVVWWELFGVVGLLLLAHVFLPVYYRYGCTTVTELLERRYGDVRLRTAVSILFLGGNTLIFLPIMLYTSALFLRALFDLDLSILTIAALVSAVGAAYAVFGGLRAVAVSDTFNGVLVFGMALLVAFLALQAVHWDLSGLPTERKIPFGGSGSLLPWPTLLTGMVFTQLFYWSTNQTITQRALAATSLREAQKGCYAAAVIRISLVPPIVIIPGLCAYVLLGRATGDATYGLIVREVLPHWLYGAFAAAMVAATVTSFDSTLNSSAALYVCDLHQRFMSSEKHIKGLSIVVTLVFSVLAVALVPVYQGADSIIQLIQKLLGLLSMPILSAFITGLAFRNVDARAVLATLVFGAGLYAVFTFAWSPLHFLHLMFITLVACILFALLVNRLVFGRRATLARGLPTAAEAAASRTGAGQC